MIGRFWDYFNFCPRLSTQFRLFIHESIIVEYDIKSKYPEEYSTVDKKEVKNF